ncbi:MAG: 50S ribosomal protein L13 [Planctomycetota bacterium]
MSTTFAKESEVQRSWYACSADGEVLGRLAARIVKVLTGKNKPSYTPHVDCGDYVIITDAEKIAVTGTKEQDKLYRAHTGYVGGLKEINLARMRREKPELIIHNAVKRMLPKTTLGRHMLAKLKVFAGPEHPHAAQKPAPLP